MNTPYENLAKDINMQAVKDYQRGDVERFFRSGWFGLLTKVDPEILISRLSKEVA